MDDVLPKILPIVLRICHDVGLFVLCSSISVLWANGHRSRGIVHRQPAINNKLAPKPTAKPNPNPTLTVP